MKLDPAIIQLAEKAVERIQRDYAEWADEDLGALEATLNDFLDDRTELTALDINVVASHVSALRAVYVEFVRDDGGNTGRALLIGLQNLIEKANVAGAA